MPDAITVRDPFEKASPAKEVVRIQWESQLMQILLPDLGNHFSVRPLNPGNDWSTTAKDSSFLIRPGAYLLVQQGKETDHWTADSRSGLWRLGEFAAPPANRTPAPPDRTPAPADHTPPQPDRTPILVDDPRTEIPAGKPDTIRITVAGLDPEDKISLQLTGARPMRPIPFQRNSIYHYSAALPEGLLTPGILTYRILIQKGNDYYSYPGNYKGNPSDWDYYHNDSYELSVLPAGSGLLLYDAAADRHTLAYPVFRRGVETRLIPAGEAGRLVFHLAAVTRSASAGPGDGASLLGFQTYFGDRIAARSSELAGFHTIVIRARSVGTLPVKATLALITKDATPFAGTLTLGPEFRDIEIPIGSLQKDSLLLLPRPYPDFMPLWFTPAGQSTFSLSDAERLQITVDPGTTGTGTPSGTTTPYGIEVESVWLKK
jgi:hypothetical protein